MAKHVIVIGAGVVGLACAWRLRRRGHRVTLLDPSPASGASHAAAGMLAAVSEYYFEEESLLALSLPASRLYPQIIAELARRTGGPTGFRDIPTIVATADSADRERLEHLGDQQRSIGLTVTALTPSKAREMESFFSPRISGAFLAEDDRQVNPRVLAGAYLSDLEADEGCDVRPLAATELLWRDGAVVGVRAAAVPGAEVFTHRFDERAVDTDEMTGDAPSWSSQDLPAGDSIDIAADLVVVANGLLSPTLAGLPEGLEWPIRPVYGDVIRLRTPEHLRPLLTRTVRGLVRGRSVYIVPREDGTIVIGATEREDGRDAVLGGGVLQLLRDAQDLVPAVAELELVEATARPRPGTPDNAPILGPIAPGLIADTGTYRHGILLSAQTAVVVADFVDGTAGKDEWAAFDPWRWSKQEARA
ncbi:FAD-dependent oxidoreductase [Propionibacterium freudenreichii]|uniref:FAD-dependent oxidoreductase n=1 Tax=Propionibacterium freudenreichii TaxID=1744 RepID=UPI0005A5C77C|nr:FAD-dependent oxidoreductase [Propionibacterium freudenreichii]MDK9612264.1 FAD-dependent oxidoreductase [Propionibacterium freudenreichii]MDK9619943.1 FAD-dependent oxidoreductase [Propionibacterium freudenreichii]MDK9622172.1 FAD-dependent oxidoreductase [Propionibacterium freudenreichii]MDK9676471.1 FAD-dependent oxidoreductase [Propionibacterium freudenreichii]WFF32256.1 FAD-dependent oxidoreductase [Propionibacterium freudenreichii]